MTHSDRVAFMTLYAKTGANMFKLKSNVQNSFFEVAKSFFNPETLIPFLVGAIFLSVLGNAISDILKAIIGNSINDAIKIALGSVLTFYILRMVSSKIINQKFAASWFR